MRLPLPNAFLDRLKGDEAFRTKVVDYLYVTGLVVVFVLAAYVLAVG